MSKTGQGWRTRLHGELLEAARRGEWLQLGELFPRYEGLIPLHMAMRWCATLKRQPKSASDARWKIFTFSIARFHFDDEPCRLHMRPRLVPASRVRLKSNGNVCPVCSGPLYAKYWGFTTRHPGICFSCGYDGARRQAPPMETGRSWEDLRTLIHKAALQGKGVDLRVADVGLLDMHISISDEGQVISIRAARR